jgi:DNA invertase Pin-like site-specific DNA recombinase
MRGEGVTKPKAVGYIRVSTDRQADNGLGLEVQEQEIRRRVKANGLRLVAMIRDEGVSGTLDASERPGLALALRMIAGKEDIRAEALIVARLDRLARSLTIQEAVLALVWKAGGRVFTADGGEVLQDDPEDPGRTAIRQMLGVFAQLERAMITKRMRSGRRLKRQNGGYAGGGPALGFKAESGKLVPDETEQVVLERIRELHGEGKSLREIARTLEAEGHRPKRAAKWQPESIRRIVGRF